MPDSISIVDFEIATRIGVTPEERAAEQRILVTVHMDTDLKSAAEADDIGKTIDYAAVARDIAALAATERKTLERLAEDAAQTILKTYRPRRVAVTVKKFVLPGAKETSVTVRRP